MVCVLVGFIFCIFGFYAGRKSEHKKALDAEAPRIQAAYMAGIARGRAERQSGWFTTLN